MVGWGSTYGVLKEAVDSLSGRERIAFLHFSELFPFPGRTSSITWPCSRSAKRTICVENNATSQFARLMRAETGFSFGETINKYDGRPYLLETLLGELDGRLRRL